MYFTKRIPKTIIFALMLLTSIWSSSFSALAAEGRVMLDIWNNDEIEFDETDCFILTIEDAEGYRDAITISVTDQISSSYYYMEEGKYTVIDVVYVGTNTAIESAGYCSSSSFIVDEDGSKMLFIAIGESAIKTLAFRDEDCIIKDAYHDENGVYIGNVTEDDTTENATEQDIIDDEVEAENIDNDADADDIDAEDDNNNDAVVTDENNDSSSTTTSLKKVGNSFLVLGKRALITAVIAAIVLAVVRKGLDVAYKKMEEDSDGNSEDNV